MSSHVDPRPRSSPVLVRAGSIPNSFAQVLLSYLQRPAFQVLVIALTASFLLVWGLDAFDHFYWRHNRVGMLGIINNTLWILFEMLVFMAPFALALVLAIMLAAQTREQLTNWRAQVLPGFRSPHVRTAMLTFAILALILAVPLSTRGGWPWISFLPNFATLLVLLTLVAWMIIRGSPVSVVVVALILIFVCASPRTREAWGGLEHLLFRRHVRPLLPADLTTAMLSVAVVCLDLLVLWRVLAGVRPAGSRKTWRADPSVIAKRSSLHLPARRPVGGYWLRVWHRRRGVHPAGLSIWAAVLLTAFVIALCYGQRLSYPQVHAAGAFSTAARDHSVVLLALVLLTLSPGLLAAAIWAERWRILEYEKLFPGSRRGYVNEMALVLAINLVEFWLAGACAVVVAVATVEPGELTSRAFALSVLASALAQIVIFGALFLLSAFRSMVPYLIVMTLLMIAIAIPMELTWAPRPDLAISGLLRIAAIEMLAGLCLAWAGARAWRRADLG